MIFTTINFEFLCNHLSFFLTFKWLKHFFFIWFRNAKRVDVVCKMMDKFFFLVETHLLENLVFNLDLLSSANNCIVNHLIRSFTVFISIIIYFKRLWLCLDYGIFKSSNMRRFKILRIDWTSKTVVLWFVATVLVLQFRHCLIMALIFTLKFKS